jgi:hypothetical protein
MADKKVHARRDTNRVSLNEEEEIRYWTGRFEVSVSALTDAVAAVGPGVQAVGKYLIASTRMKSSGETYAHQSQQGRDGLFSRQDPIAFIAQGNQERPSGGAHRDERSECNAGVAITTRVESSPLRLPINKPQSRSVNCQTTRNEWEPGSNARATREDRKARGSAARSRHRAALVPITLPRLSFLEGND